VPSDNFQIVAKFVIFEYFNDQYTEINKN